MKMTCKKLLALAMALVILGGSCRLPQEISEVYASQVQVEAEESTSDKASDIIDESSTQEKDDQEEKEEIEEEENTQKEDSTEESKEESEDSIKDDQAEEEKTEEEKTAEEASTESRESAETEQENNSAETATTEQTMPVKNQSGIVLHSSGGPHDVDMPDVTSHYFKLQKDSKKVANASGKYLKVVADVKSAAQYIYSEMENGNKYTFTPQKTKNTTVTVGGGNGGKLALSTVSGSNHARFGNIYEANQKGAIQSGVFNLERCSSNPYAVYTNVGSWFDENERKTYSVDMKLTVTGYLYPSKEIRSQLRNQYTAPYVGFRKDIIGIEAMATDYVETSMTFYYHGTDREISDLHGVIQFCDIDAQQGVDFGKGFQKIVMFNASNSHLQYNSNGIISGSKGYLSSRTGANFNAGDTRTTALGLFSGSQVICRWSIAKCDHKDTGGKAAYAVAGGYGIPADDSNDDAISYYYSNSTGFLGIYTDLALIPIPEELDKNVYEGAIDPSSSAVDQKNISLKDRQKDITFVLTGAAADSSDFSKARYSDFEFNDTLEAAFKTDINRIKVFTERSILEADSEKYSDVTDQFEITLNEDEKHRSNIHVEAKKDALSNIAFYGKTYYVHINVSVRSEEELQKNGYSITDWYQDSKKAKESGLPQKYVGTFTVDNDAKLYVITNQGVHDTLKTEKSRVTLPIRLLICKFANTKEETVEGVTFGLFGGKAIDYHEGMEPLMTAVSDEDGFVLFEGKDTFYQEKYGDGPYYVKEIGVPEKYKNVWSPAIDSSWTYVIEALSDINMLLSKEKLVKKIVEKEDGYQENILVNQPKDNSPNCLHIYKESKDTGEKISGAEFMLYQWSEEKKEYIECMKLVEGKDEKNIPYYYNEKSFTNTLDNLGKYKVVEIKAPYGCVLNEKAWLFESNEQSKEFTYTFQNPLQRGKIKIVKTDEEGQPLSGVKFSVKAAEDIYVPWKSEKETSKESLLVAKGTIVDTLVTNNDGIAETKAGQELYIGNYYVEEIEGASGYVCDKTRHHVKLSYSEKDSKNPVSYTLKVNNKKMQPAMSIAKLADHTTDSRGQKPVLNEQSGRYLNEKITGNYQSGEDVEYRITVTNTGNVELYELKMEDKMDKIHKESGYCLADVLEEGAAFLLPKEGYYLSKQGEKVTAALDEENKLTMTLDHLGIGDSVEVTIKGKVKENMGNMFGLRNFVSLSAKYQNKQGHDSKPDLVEVNKDNLKDEKGNSLTEDWDDINISGKPFVKVAKLADRTSGVTLENGRYKGNKVEGIYGAGDTLNFTITISNTGSADIYQVKVEDTMEDALLKLIDEKTVSFKEGIYLSQMGQEIRGVEKKSEKGSKVLLLDSIAAGDSVELHMTATLKTPEKSVKHLKNYVKITGEYQAAADRFEQIPYHEEMEDQDKISVGCPDLSVAKLADKTTGVTLEKGRYKGTKVSGTYKKGEIVSYLITVRNSGESDVKDIVVTEEPSKDLLVYADVVGFKVKQGETLTTAKGNMTTVIKNSENTLSLDTLKAGDSVEIIYQCRVREKIVDKKGLTNIVKVSGKNPNNTIIPKTSKMKDKDDINLGKNKSTTGRRTPGGGTTYSYSNPKTGDSANPWQHALGAGCAMLGLAYCLWRIRKRT